jgi:hypothetical protein
MVGLLPGRLLRRWTGVGGIGATALRGNLKNLSSVTPILPRSGRGFAAPEMPNLLIRRWCRIRRNPSMTSISRLMMTAAMLGALAAPALAQGAANTPANGGAPSTTTSGTANGAGGRVAGQPAGTTHGVTPATGTPRPGAVQGAAVTGSAGQAHAGKPANAQGSAAVGGANAPAGTAATRTN